MFSGYVRLRRGVLDHLHQGRMSFSEYGIYTILVQLADSRSGCAFSNAKSLEALIGRGLKQQRIQDILFELHLKGYIRPFGQRHVGSGSYPILIHRYQITSGEKKDWFVDAFNTKDYRKPKLVKEQDDVPGAWGADLTDEQAERIADEELEEEIRRMEEEGLFERPKEATAE
jgi:hypothetical protein